MTATQKPIVIFFINSSSGTGQFARLESASRAITKNYEVIWISPKAKNPINEVKYYKNVHAFYKENNNANVANIIFSSESDILKNMVNIFYLRNKFLNFDIIFMQRIDSYKNYKFNFYKSFSPKIFIRMISFPFIIVFSSLFINKYIFQTPFAMKDYFLNKNFACILMSFFFKRKNKIHILPNNSGLEWNKSFEEFKEDKKSLHLNCHKNKIVYIGNLQFFGKGIDMLIDSFKLLDKEKYKLILIGKIPSQFSVKISQISQHMKNNDYDINFLGHLNNPHKYLYDHRTIFVSASKLDLCPNSVLEALQFNVPILLSDIDAHKFIIRDQNLIFKSDDREELKNKIINLFSNKDSWEINKNLVSRYNTEFDFNWNKKFLSLMAK